MSSLKFDSDIDALKATVELSGVIGEWSQKTDIHWMFKAKSGAVLNWWSTKKTLNFQGKTETKDEFQKAFEKACDGEAPKQRATPALKKANKKTKIFVVHGHDSVALDQLELILRRLDLDPYILQSNDAESKTIVEALEKQIYEESAFGIILMTPDDYGYPKTKGEVERQPRARQNVILEMGMLMASLGREKMVILKKGALELPSDIGGVIYQEFNEHVKEVAVQLARRMAKSGIDIDDSLVLSVGS